MKEYNTDELENIAKKVRRNIIEEVYVANSGHPGSALSCVEILTVLYFYHMNICLSVMLMLGYSVMN